MDVDPTSGRVDYRCGIRIVDEMDLYLDETGGRKYPRKILLNRKKPGEKLPIFFFPRIKVNSLLIDTEIFHRKYNHFF